MRIIGIDPGPKICHCVAIEPDGKKWRVVEMCEWDPQKAERPALEIGTMTRFAVEDFTPQGHARPEGVATAKNIGRIDARLGDDFSIVFVPRSLVSSYFDLKSVATITRYQVRGADALLNAILKESMDSVPKGSHYRSAIAVAITSMKALGWEFDRGSAVRRAYDEAAGVLWCASFDRPQEYGVEYRICLSWRPPVGQSVSTYAYGDNVVVAFSQARDNAVKLRDDLCYLPRKKETIQFLDREFGARLADAKACLETKSTV